MAVNGDQPSDAAEWESIAQHRQEKIEELMEENRRLTFDLYNAQVTVRAPFNVASNSMR